MNSFREKLRETFGIVSSELEEDGDGGGGDGGAVSGGSTSDAGTTTDDVAGYHGPIGNWFGAWRSRGKCPDGTTKDEKTGSCKKK